MKLVLSISLAGAMLLAGFPARAEQHLMRVDLRTLRLDTLAGAALAAQRISDAATVFCRTPAPATGSGSRAAHTSVALDVTTLKCRRDMTRRALSQLGDHQVSAAFLTSSESW
ncbi:UrcA family protein [Phenylobacterium soli]|uniref:UrcA family protein n=1 Tax=Phenylobacterium soli TaxID=2170551 RepID=A0A328AMM1_9CAUL|nr:UrcA family protein [Phenylobacterium soli]RAK56140.1 hypothetical protein DJ017_17280 [Phenylobacterium soli]